MQPNTDNNAQNSTPQSRSVSFSGSYYQNTPYQTSPADTQHQSAANVARSQLDNIYASDPNANMPTPAPQPVVQQATATPNIAQPAAQPAPQQYVAQPTSTPLAIQPTQQNQAVATQTAVVQPTTLEQASADTKQTGDDYVRLRKHSPYAKHHSEQHLTADENQWKQYHSAWQNYYQEYFYRYYGSHMAAQNQQLQQKYAELQQREAELGKPEGMTEEDAVNDLRSQIRKRVQDTAKTVRKSRHFMPIASALVIMIIFLLLQYNRVLASNIISYTSPGNVEPDNIIVDPSIAAPVGPDPKLIIPKINVDVPIVWDTTPDYDSQMKAMEKGVAWFGIPGANSKPGQVGNTVLSGHSSNDWLDSGVKFVFARLERMGKGDTVYINYQGKRYTYTVTNTQVVSPNDWRKLVYDTKKPELTLITCVPLGTSLNRLLVTAEQVDPNPSNATAASTTSTTTQPKQMTSTTPSFFERLFGGGNKQ